MTQNNGGRDTKFHLHIATMDDTDKGNAWWDGNKEGFHCLVNAHKLTGPDGLGRRTLEAITYSYLGDWIERQKAEP